MPNKKHIDLTSAVYKILDFFPEEELLKNKIKGKALEIMENLILVYLPDNPHPNSQKGKAAIQVLKDIEVLKGYLALGKSQGWVDNLNLLILFKEYDKIKEEIRPIVVLTEKETAKKESNFPNNQSKEIMPVNNIVKKEGISSEEKLSSRQQEILKILETQKKAQVADFKKSLPDVTKRTLRRDLDDLLKKQKVIRVGEWNQVFYQLSGSSRGPTSENKETLPAD